MRGRWNRALPLTPSVPGCVFGKTLLLSPHDPLLGLLEGRSPPRPPASHPVPADERASRSKRFPSHHASLSGHRRDLSGFVGYSLCSFSRAACCDYRQGSGSREWKERVRRRYMTAFTRIRMCLLMRNCWQRKTRKR